MARRDLVATAPRIRDGVSRRGPQRPAATSAEFESAPAVVNRQSKVRIRVAPMRRFVCRMAVELGLAGCGFNVGFVDDRKIARLNARFRGEPTTTDVLSFSWQESPDSGFRIPDLKSMPWRKYDSRFRIPDLKAFLGDIVISAETARRHARAEGHSVERECHWLILHGVLHLCGFDHERDNGEMTVLELKLRRRLRI